MQINKVRFRGNHRKSAFLSSLIFLRIGVEEKSRKFNLVFSNRSLFDFIVVLCLVVVLVVNLIFTVLLVKLMIFHGYLKYKGMTTYEYIKGKDKVNLTRLIRMQEANNQQPSQSIGSASQQRSNRNSHISFRASQVSGDKTDESLGGLHMRSVRNRRNNQNSVPRSILESRSELNNSVAERLVHHDDCSCHKTHDHITPRKKNQIPISDNEKSKSSQEHESKKESELDQSPRKDFSSLKDSSMSDIKLKLRNDPSLPKARNTFSKNKQSLASVNKLESASEETLKSDHRVIMQKKLSKPGSMQEAGSAPNKRNLKTIGTDRKPNHKRGSEDQPGSLKSDRVMMIKMGNFKQGIFNSKKNKVLPKGMPKSSQKIKKKLDVPSSEGIRDLIRNKQDTIDEFDDKPPEVRRFGSSIDILREGSFFD